MDVLSVVEERKRQCCLERLGCAAEANRIGEIADTLAPPSKNMVVIFRKACYAVSYGIKEVSDDSC